MKKPSSCFDQFQSFSLGQWSSGPQLNSSIMYYLNHPDKWWINENHTLWREQVRWFLWLYLLANLFHSQEVSSFDLWFAHTDMLNRSRAWIQTMIQWKDQTKIPCRYHSSQLEFLLWLKEGRQHARTQKCDEDQPMNSVWYRKLNGEMDQRLTLPVNRCKVDELL